MERKEGKEGRETGNERKKWKLRTHRSFQKSALLTAIVFLSLMLQN